MKKRIQTLAYVTSLAFFIPLVASASSFALGRFTAYDDAAWPDAVVIGDVTGDGRPDAVMATGTYFDPETDYHIFIYAQTAQGTLAPPVKLPYLGTAGMHGTKMQIADLNRDGIQDIIVGHNEGLTVFVSLGKLGFTTTKTALAGNFSALGAADLNHDGNIDVVRQASDGIVKILMGDGAGGFTAVRTIAGTSAWNQALRIGDVTGEGHLDLVFTNQLSLTVHPGRGTGDFMSPRVIPYPDADDPRGFSSVAIGDVNRDGRNDVLATTSANPPRAKIWFFNQKTDGTLAPPTIMPTYDMPEALMVADLDFNGYADVITPHGGWYVVGYFLQGRYGFDGEYGAYVPYATHYRQDGLATGDINGDGCTDIALADYNNGLVVVPGYGCYEPWEMANHHDGDFDGDGKADILWHNAATGASTIWRSGNSAASLAMTRVTDTRWTIAGSGDFNGDGRSDVLWHNTATGDNVVWHSANYQQRVSLTRITDRNWKIVGIGDFDGDGKDDILWRHKYSGANAIWGGGSYGNARSLVAMPEQDWKVVGIGDFDADGRSDIFWRHGVNGRNTIWPSGNASLQRTLTDAPDGWQVAGVGDFDNDGRSDILWHFAFTGRNVIWRSADSARSQSLDGLTDPSWKIVGVGDYANDGRSDILWRNRRTGANAIWRDANSATRHALTSTSTMNWQVMR